MEQEAVGLGLSYTATDIVDGVHYWRVRAVNSLGIAGAWSGARAFTVDTVIPGKPGLVSPAAGAVVLTTVPNLAVSAVTGGASYQYQWDDAADFSTPLGTSVWTGTSYTLTAGQALPFGQVYWRAQARDAAWNESGWSDARLLNVTILGAPANGSYTTNTKPVFSWAAAAGALEYRLRVDDSAAFDSPEIDLNRPVSTSYTPVVALPTARYYWQMQVRTAAGWSNWTPVYSFTVTPALPAVPVQDVPVAGQISYVNTPELKWKSAVNGNTYQVQISKVSTFITTEADVVGGVGILNYTTGPLINGVHYWRVRAVNSLGIAGAWSGARAFTVVTPTAPVLTSPYNNTVLIAIPNYVWTSSVGAKTYQFQYARDVAFTSPTTVNGLTSTTYKPASLSFGVYYWHVRAIDAAGNLSPWSSTYRILYLLPF